MLVNDIVDGVVAAPCFEGWAKGKKASLIQLFAMVDAIEELENKAAWQVGFITDQGRDITSFFAGEEGQVSKGPTGQAVMPEAPLHPLDMDTVAHDVLDIVSPLESKHEGFAKLIVLLRGAVPEPEYAITFFSMGEGIHSYLYSAVSGELLNASTRSLAELFRRDDGKPLASDDAEDDAGAQGVSSADEGSSQDAFTEHNTTGSRDGTGGDDNAA